MNVPTGDVIIWSSLGSSLFYAFQRNFPARSDNQQSPWAGNESPPDINIAGIIRARPIRNFDIYPGKFAAALQSVVIDFVIAINGPTRMSIILISRADHATRRVSDACPVIVIRFLRHVASESGAHYVRVCARPICTRVLSVKLASW